VKTINQAFAILVGLLLLGALVIAGIAAIEYISSLYMALDPQLARATAIVLFVVLIAAWIITHSIRRAAAQQMRQQFSNEISATYQYFVDHWIEIIDHGRQSDSNPEAQQVLDRLIALYGSADAIKAHLALRTMMQQKDMQDANMHAQLGKALLAIRKDLGSDTQGITAQELQQLVLPEPDLDVRPDDLAQPQLDSEPTSGV